MHESGFPDVRIDPGLAGKVGNVELAAADRFDVGQRRPDEVLDTGILGRAYRRGCLLALVGAFLPEICDQKDAMCPCKCRVEGCRSIQVCFDDLVGDYAMLAWIAGQGAHLELAVSLQGT